MKKLFSTLNFQISYQAEVKIPVSPKRVYILLHGYKQSGEYIFKQLKDQVGDDCAIIAPNGPFFIPIEKKGEYQMRYGWYFFDPIKKTYFIDFNPAADFVKSMLIEMDLIKKPMTIIGYSQGGYLAPKLAEIIPSVDTVIGLACVFRNHLFGIRPSTMIHQINSNCDPIIDFKGAKDEFSKLRQRGNLGRFVELNGVGHKLDQIYISELAKLL